MATMRVTMEIKRVMSVDAVEAGGVLGKAGVTVRNWAPPWGLIAFQLCLAPKPLDAEMLQTIMTLSWTRSRLAFAPKKSGR